MNTDVVIDAGGIEVERDQCLLILALIILDYKIKFLSSLTDSAKHFDPQIQFFELRM